MNSPLGIDLYTVKKNNKRRTVYTAQFVNIALPTGTTNSFWFPDSDYLSNLPSNRRKRNNNNTIMDTGDLVIAKEWNLHCS